MTPEEAAVTLCGLGSVYSDSDDGLLLSAREDETKMDMLTVDTEVKAEVSLWTWRKNLLSQQLTFCQRKEKQRGEAMLSAIEREKRCTLASNLFHLPSS